MKKTTLVATALVTALSASSAFAWWGEGHKGSEHNGKNGCRSESREHSCNRSHKGGRSEKMEEHMNRSLTASEVKTLQEARLIYKNNPNLKVGDITATDTGYKVNIVTKDNSLVEEFDLAKNGMSLERYESVQKRLEQRQNRASENSK